MFKKNKHKDYNLLREYENFRKTTLLKFNTKQEYIQAFLKGDGDYEIYYLKKKIVRERFDLSDSDLFAMLTELENICKSKK